MDAGPQPRRAVELERAHAAIGEGEIEAAAAFALDQEARARGEEGLAVGEKVGERTPGDIAVVAAEQAAGRAVGVEHDLVAGDEQALVEQLEQGEVDAGLGTLREVRDEGLDRGGAGGGRQARRASGRVHDGVEAQGKSVQAPRGRGLQVRSQHSRCLHSAVRRIGGAGGPYLRPSPPSSTAIGRWWRRSGSGLPAAAAVGWVGSAATTGGLTGS